RKSAPVPSHQQAHHHSHHDASEDLHAWSLFRQNLNANFSESALGGPPANGYHKAAKAPNGPPATAGASASNFQLRESTVNNILSHPKYGAQLKNQDAF